MIIEKKKFLLKKEWRKNKKLLYNVGIKVIVNQIAGTLTG